MKESNNIEEMKDKKEEEIKFLADRMLGKLVKWLRILGYDTTYPSFDDDLSLILTARQEGRILLTRDANLIKRRNICDFLFIKGDHWEEQLAGIIKGLKLKIDLNSKIFSRCSLCNTPTEDVNKEEAKNYVPPYVFLTQDKFVYCPSCKKFYWRGTHWKRMTQKIQKFSFNVSGNNS
jgi:uncharacterized protein with PIN domain